MHRSWFALALGLALPAQAADKPEPFKLEMVAAPVLPAGQSAHYGGIADATPLELMVPGLGIFQAVSIAVATDAEEREILIEIRKDGEETVAFTGSTKGSGLIETKFRTQGDVIVSVSSPSGEAPFEIVVWAGDTLQPTMKPVTTPLAEGAP